MKEKICLIVGGAGITQYERLREAAETAAFCIVCDSGQKHIQGLGLKPDLFVGDFDSSEKPDTAVETIVLPREKDDTDTIFAVKEGLKRGYREFLLLGVIGERFDHSFVNVSALLYLDHEGAHGVLMDDWSEMELVGRETKRITPEHPWFSLLALSGEVSGVTIRNAKYPLRDAVIDQVYQYATSNEPLPHKTAEVSADSGLLLLIRGNRV